MSIFTKAMVSLYIRQDEAGGFHQVDEETIRQRALPRSIQYVLSCSTCPRKENEFSRSELHDNVDTDSFIFSNEGIIERKAQLYHEVIILFAFMDFTCRNNSTH